MKPIPELLKEKVTFSVEIVPPRNGADPQQFLAKLAELKKLNVDFISVTKGAGGSLRGGTLPVCYIAKEKHGLNVIAHFTCRQHDARTIENELVDHHYFGLTNILALRGDPPDFCEEKDTWIGEYEYAYKLVQKITELNEGKYFLRKGFDKSTEIIDGNFKKGLKTNFCVGVAAHPDHEDFKQGIKYFKKKVDAGAEYAITQMVFDVNSYKRFIEGIRKEGITIPVIAGVWPMLQEWRLDQAEHKFKVKVPDEFKQLRGLDADEFREKGLQLTIRLCKDLLKAGAPGIQLFIFDHVEIAGEIFKAIRK